MRTSDRNRIVGRGTPTPDAAAVSTPAWVDTNMAGAGLALGSDVVTAVYAMWSLLTRTPATTPSSGVAA